MDPDASNININDVLGNYSLTLVDTLDTLAVMVSCLACQRWELLVLALPICISLLTP